MVNSFKAIAVGGSAGSIDPLLELLGGLTTDFPIPVFVVVHVSPSTTTNIADLFQRRCSIRCMEAEDKAPIEMGHVYFAPPNYHLLIEPTGVLSLSGEELINYSRPSIDLLFETCSVAYGKHALGIVLSGANSDGAQGLRQILDRAGTGIIQSPTAAEAPAMPQAACAICPTAQVMEMQQIANYLSKLEVRP